MDEVNQNKSQSTLTDQLINPQQLEVNDLVQIDPSSQLGEKQGFFAGCFMVITEVKPWGCQGYIPSPRGRGEMPGPAYYRATWDQMQRIGKAVWVVD